MNIPSCLTCCTSFQASGTSLHMYLQQRSEPSPEWDLWRTIVDPPKDIHADCTSKKILIMILLVPSSL